MLQDHVVKAKQFKDLPERDTFIFLTGPVGQAPTRAGEPYGHVPQVMVKIDERTCCVLGMLGRSGSACDPEALVLQVRTFSSLHTAETRRVSPPEKSFLQRLFS